MFNDMKWINADFCFGEIFPCDGNKAVAHIAAEIEHLPALLRGELMKVLVDNDTGDQV